MCRIIISITFYFIDLCSCWFQGWCVDAIEGGTGWSIFPAVYSSWSDVLLARKPSQQQPRNPRNVHKNPAWAEPGQQWTTLQDQARIFREGGYSSANIMRSERCGIINYGLHWLSCFCFLLHTFVCGFQIENEQHLQGCIHLEHHWIHHSGSTNFKDFNGLRVADFDIAQHLFCYIIESLGESFPTKKRGNQKP